MNKIAEALKLYHESDFYPFHMPGHKQHLIGEWMKLDYDITEIEGFDNLHQPTGILQAAQQEAACIYGAKESFFLVNGSTCGILAAIWATKGIGKGLILGRNCHKSVYHGCELARVETHYIYPQVTSLGIDGGITPGQVENEMNEHPNAKVVFLTSPTYDGVVSDIQTIAEIVHKKNGILIIDCAHGAHFGMHDFFPKSPIQCGADLVIMSLHKTLPSPTQTAILHLCSERVHADAIQEALNIFQTSSPSYLLIAGIQECVNYVKNNQRNLFDNFVDRLSNFYSKCGKLPSFQLSQVLLHQKEVFDLDLSKILIFPQNKMDGPKLDDILRREYHLEMEMTQPDYVTALTSCMDTNEGFERLYQALVQIDKENQLNHHSNMNPKEKTNLIRADKKLEIWEAMEQEGECLPITKASNRISKSYLYLYPPGIPILAPGELVSEELMMWSKKMQDMGLRLEGALDDRNTVIKVVK